MKNKVLVVGDGWGQSYYSPFSEFGEPTTNNELLWTNPHSISLVVFTGGADVAPSLYGEEASRETSSYPKRDIFETIVFQKAHSLHKPKVGICRGAQFLNVMA